MRFIDRLKQGLRELGRSAPPSHSPPAAELAPVGTDRSLEFKRRSELDPATAAPGPRTTQQGEQLSDDGGHQPPAPVSTRLKKAVLSKARRAVQPRQAAATIWGPLAAPATGATSLFGTTPVSEGQGLLAGANLTGADQQGPSHDVAHAAQAPVFAAPTARPDPQPTPHTVHALWGTPPPTSPGSLGAAPSDPTQPPPLFGGATLFGANDDLTPPERLF